MSTPVRARTRRSERLVPLRSTMPVNLVTLRHSVPLRLQGIQPEALKATTTSKVDPADRAAETTTRKNGDAR